MKIVLIGAGNVATSIGYALLGAGHNILQIYSRTTESANKLSTALHAPYTNSLQDICTEADVYIYALADNAYPMQAVGNKSAIHLLTAGSVAYTAISGAQHRGTIYPFQTFSAAQPLKSWSAVPLLIEANDDYTLQYARTLAKSLSQNVYEANAESRASLHLAGVLANNFTNCLYAIAAEQLEKANLPFDILLPLIDETAQKVHTLSPRQAQTGPARRGDKAVIEKHLKLLRHDSQLTELYKLLTDNIISHLH